jgi:hypothetical protein
MGGSARYLGAAAAIVCLAALTASTGVAASSGRARSAHRVRTYSTPGTGPLVTAVDDPTLFGGSQRDEAFAMVRSAGAAYVRIPVPWSAIAPHTRPAGFVPGDPTSPGYSWAGFDAVVQAAVSAGETPMLDISNPPPRWAYARRPSGVNAGSPKASQLGQFAHALAVHYDGEAGLPAAHVFQVWNEPNLSLDLRPASGSVYRGMVNAVASGVHGVDAANLVVAGGLDPFGHPKGYKQKWHSVAPLAFMRSALCLSKGSHPHSTCRSKIHFDAWSHHPYTFAGPFGHAKRKDDVSLGDLPKMRDLLRAAVKLHHLVSPHPVQFWVTEFSWDTNPPRPHAVPLRLQARWTAESLYQMWRSGVSLVTWFLLQDRPNPSPYQSGLYFHSKALADAKAKPTLTAFRFPFVAYLGNRTVTVWGRNETSNKSLVTIQLAHKQGGPWRTVAKIGTNRSGIFKASLKLKATSKDWLRATASPGASKSLPFSLTVPKVLHVGPWGN